MSINSTMTALADEVRRIAGVDGTLSIDQMATLLQGVTLGGKTVVSVRCVTTGANGWLLGDCNGDSVYTNQDLFAMRTAPLDIADVNGDGVADDDDAQLIGDAVAELLADECLCRVELTYDDGSVDKIVTKVKRTGITPSGSIEITENGTHDVAAYAHVIVNVEGDTGMIAKTTMDSVAIPNTAYFLGEQTTVNIVLPDDAEIGKMITVVWYNGTTAATLSITGDVLNFDYVPNANTRSEINALWDGTYWAVIGNEIEVPANA